MASQCERSGSESGSDVWRDIAKDATFDPPRRLPSEPLGIDVEGHGERLLVAALATPLPSLVGVYAEAELGSEGENLTICVDLIGRDV